MTALLCDLDGLLIDSEGLHYDAYKIMLADYGIDLTLEMFVESWLSGKQYGTRYYLNKAGITDEKELHRARARKADLFCELAKGKLSLLPGVKLFLEAAKTANIPCAIGTGGYRQEYEFSAQECGLNNYMDVFVGGDDVEHNKPAPDIYLRVATQLGVEPNDCVVFENSVLGMKAGLQAGMRCMVIPSEYTLDQDFTGATNQFARIDEIDLHTLFV